MSEQAQVDNLVKIATAYAEGKETTLQAVGRKFYGNSRFFAELIAGKRSISLEKYYGMIRAMRRTWPADVEWPRTSVVTIDPLR